MTNITNLKTMAWIALLFVMSGVIFIQSQVWLHWDVSFLMEATQRFLAGGTYTEHFYETNPPMILYLYIPPVRLGMDYFGFSKANALIGYVCLLSLFAMYLCDRLAKKIFAEQPDFYFVFLLSLASIFLLIPAYEFGQREHLFVILVTPYLLLIAARIKNNSISSFTAIAIGLFAGFGFAIKPFFPILFFCLEFYYLSQKRSWNACFRIETILIALVIVTYLISVYFIFPDYLNTIVPLLFKLYYPGFGLAFSDLILNEKMLHCLLLLITLICLRFIQKQNTLFDVLFWAFLSGLLIYLLEGTVWFYHLLPALSIGTLLSILLTYTFFKKTSASSSVAHFIFLAIFSYVTYYAFALTYFNLNELIHSVDNKNRTALIRFLNHYPPNTTWMLISTKAVVFPITDEKKLHSVSRFPNYWWLPGIIHSEKKAAYLPYFTHLVTQDLTQHQPKLVLVDVAPYNTELHSPNINYLALFSLNRDFHNFWQHYRYITTVAYFDIYEHQTP